MTKRIWVALFIFALCTGAASAQDAKTVLQNATKAMGDIKSIQYSGTGHNNALGQSYTPNSKWPESNVTSYAPNH